MLLCFLCLFVAGQKELTSLDQITVKPRNFVGPPLALERAVASVSPMYKPDVSEIAQAILDHLRRNPEAQDTLAGIVQWWLPSQEIKPRTATIKDALSELVAAGLIIRIEGKDTQVSYRLCAFENQSIDPSA